MTHSSNDYNNFYCNFLNIPFASELAMGFLADEDKVVRELLSNYDRHYSHYEIATLAKQLIDFSRENYSPVGLELLLQEYPLSSKEGLVLMNLAEALLRIPDKATALMLTREQFMLGQWIDHIAHNESWFVNLSTWGVLLSKKLLQASDQSGEDSAGNILSSLTARIGEQSVISAVHYAVSFLSKQFVIGESIHDALVNSQQYIARGYYFSYDMLGEEAMTSEEASGYFEKYHDAILELAVTGAAEEYSASVSIKLSALHPRFEYRQKERVYKEVFDRLMQLCLLAKEHQIAITIDAEEAARCEMTLALLQMLFAQVELKGWNQLGVTVQTYQKRAPLIIEHLLDLAKTYHKIIPVRLVKGAYWDFEIKNAQQKGWQDFPVFTEKDNTDLCYLHCIEKLFAEKQFFFPQFATHNSQTIATVYYYARKYNAHNFEFQRLYGMGSMVYDGLYHLSQTLGLRKVPCRIYAPVGQRKALLPYLVRRLLENGANNSFVNQLHNSEIKPDELIINLREKLKDKDSYRNPGTPMAINLFTDRQNSVGVNLESSYEIQNLIRHLTPFLQKQWLCEPQLEHNGETVITSGEILINRNPATGEQIGKTRKATEQDCLRAMDTAIKSCPIHCVHSLTERIDILHKLAELLEYNRYELIAMLVKEAGKAIVDAVDELREGIDFCRYYANNAARNFSHPQSLNSYTGEENTLLWEGRGVFLCISPWNYPLSIFVGQICAALVTGNSVIAKPASATPLIAAKVIELMHHAGFNRQQLQLLPCPAHVIEKVLLGHPALSGVAFTGSFATARRINQQLAQREQAIIPLIAETGGINVMIADSSALSEQLVKDMLVSAFGCAGQRCSALRVAYLQDEIYDLVIKQLVGAMQELNVADPLKMSTDVGPLISSEAAKKILSYIEQMRHQGFQTITCARHEELHLLQDEQFVLPTLIEISCLDDVSEEIFGPVLHLIKYQIQELDTILQQVNSSGYGLTFGIHSRIPSRMECLAQNSFAGNVYINRNMVGAVVGVQPFGGQGMSGTGPKAGGPDYLKRFAREKTISLNTVSIGGNVQLLSK